MIVDGDINIIESAIGFAEEYVTEVSENVQIDSKFKPIRATKKQFDEFKLSQIDDGKEVSISFPITQDYLENDNTIVLTIDKWNCVERRVYLIKRPSQAV